MPKLLCMQRPKQIKRKKSKVNGSMMATSLPGIGEFTINPAAHHPFCPSADDTRFHLF